MLHTAKDYAPYAKKKKPMLKIEQQKSRFLHVGCLFFHETWVLFLHVGCSRPAAPLHQRWPPASQVRGSCCRTGDWLFCGGGSDLIKKAGERLWLHFFLVWIDKSSDHGQSFPRWMGSWI